MTALSQVGRITEWAEAAAAVDEVDGGERGGTGLGP